MARINYADINSPSLKELVGDIKAQRGKILHLYGMLLHSPPIAEGWLQYLTAIRQKSQLPGDIRELIIMRIASLNGAKYEAEQHAPYALREGISDQQLAGLSASQRSSLFSEVQSDVLALTDAVTQNVLVTDGLFAAVKKHFDERGIVEIVATISAYNMVSRFLVAMNIASSDEFGSRSSM
jgi:alkylhydroperoxidase family enzyme